MTANEAAPQESPTAASAGANRGKPRALYLLQAVWGPGLLVMLADTDAGNIVAAADAGARWGYRLAPLPLLLIPALALVQELAARIGVFGGAGFGAFVRARCGRGWSTLAAAALGICALSSLVTELTGMVGVGELFGVTRWIVAPLAGICLVLVLASGAFKRVERIALAFGLFEVAFFLVAWLAHPSAAALAQDIADQRLGDANYLFLATGLIGATFNPWMIFYQATALAKQQLPASHYGAARWETILGAIATQLLTAAILVAVAAVKAQGAGAASLASIGAISESLTPFLGQSVGRAVFGAGVVGAAMAAAIVSSLAAAWGFDEIFGAPRDARRDQIREPRFLALFGAAILASVILALAAPDLVLLAIGAQALNAAFLPLIFALLVFVAATALPRQARLRGLSLWMTAIVLAAVAAAGLSSGVAGLF